MESSLCDISTRAQNLTLRWGKEKTPTRMFLDNFIRGIFYSLRVFMRHTEFQLTRPIRENVLINID